MGRLSELRVVDPVLTELARASALVRVRESRPRLIRREIMSASVERAIPVRQARARQQRVFALSRTARGRSNAP